MADSGQGYMMKKLEKIIKNCRECFHSHNLFVQGRLRTGAFGYYCDFDKDNNKYPRLVIYNKIRENEYSEKFLPTPIPDWCPLPDVEEG